jgi:hypothetical protein
LAILALALAALGLFGPAQPATAAETPATGPIVISPATNPATASPAKKVEGVTASDVLRTTLIVLAFVAIIGSLVVKRRAIRTALRNAPPISDE